MATNSLNALTIQPIPIIIKGRAAASNGLKITKRPNSNTNVGDRYNGHDTGNRRAEMMSITSWYIPKAVSTPPKIYINMPTKNEGTATSHKPKSRLPKPANGKMRR